MKFNDTTNKNGLIQDCEFWTQLGDGTISGDTTLLAVFTSLINQMYHRVVAWILEASGEWEWDDSNYTDFPIGTTSLFDNQQDYTLPAASSTADASTLLKIIRVEVKDKDGNYQKIKRIDETEIHDLGLASFLKTAGMPKYYREIGNSIELFPPPSSNNTTLSAGLKIYFQRTPVEFTTSDTTQQPGFVAPFHRILSIGASLDYAEANGLSMLATDLKKRLYGDPNVLDNKGLKRELQEFYSTRNLDRRIRLKGRYISYA